MAIRWQERGKRNVSPRKVPLNRDTIMRVGSCAQFGDESREAVEAVMHGSGSTFQELADEGFADLLKTRKRPVEAEAQCGAALPRTATARRSFQVPSRHRPATWIPSRWRPRWRTRSTSPSSRARGVLCRAQRDARLSLQRRHRSKVTGGDCRRLLARKYPEQQ